MSKSKRTAKTDWHALSLQQLTTAEFVRVVNCILNEEYALVPDLHTDRSMECDGSHANVTPSHVASLSCWEASQDILAIEYA